MQSNIIRSQLSALGLSVSEEGLITDGSTYFGALRGDGVLDGSQDLFDVEDFEHAEYNELNRTVTLVCTSGEVPLKGTMLPKIEKEEPVVEMKPVVDDDGALVIRDIPTTVYTLDLVFDELFPEWESQLYYDELTERVMVDEAMFDEPPFIKPFEDAHVGLYHRTVEKRLMQLGFAGRRLPSSAVMDEVLNIRMMKNRRNPFRDHVESLKWDGKPRIRTWFQEVFGAVAPSLEPNEEA